jgi:hypothetical protein
MTTLIAEDLLLLLLDDDSGKLTGTTYFDTGVGGAVLVELTLAGCVEVHKGSGCGRRQEWCRPTRREPRTHCWSSPWTWSARWSAQDHPPPGPVRPGRQEARQAGRGRRLGGPRRPRLDRCRSGCGDGRRHRVDCGCHREQRLRSSGPNRQEKSRSAVRLRLSSKKKGYDATATHPSQSLPASSPRGALVITGPKKATSLT